ncbi:N-acetylglucosamine-1-phosphotransferase subunits alpha/beta-like [Montipora capricornis]|uniref:N-acetylglucosamine-1-phosphotransferase subunits alpha/beta-like n=1 Tax=Montipora capricornis TaxID=246305 RepID=UPI0035F1FF67
MKRALCQTFWKLIQRQTYTCLSSRYGIWMCIGGVLLTLISAFQFGEVVLEWSMQKYAVTFNTYHDNILGNSFQNRLCLPIPIDIVYTWVNGSDPKLLADLEKLKIQIELEHNQTTLKEIARLKTETNATDDEVAELLLKKALDKKKKAKEQAGTKSQIENSRCPFTNCVSALSVVVEDGLPGDLKLSQVREIDTSFAKATRVFNVTSSGSAKERVSIIQFPGRGETDKALKVKVRWQDKSLRSKEGYFTSDGSRPTAVNMETEIMILDLKGANEMEKINRDLKDRFENKLKSVIFHAERMVGVAYFSDKTSASSALKLSLTVDGKTVKLAPAFLIWAPFHSVLGHSPKDNDADVSASRFADNEELKYSLRSVEKHAPWVRNIYIVTNGQIPSWLNLENPRLKIITHQELFVNKSHLPTFSSPAIESHLHRIPGLSQKFIYLNDDVMFADNVWPDDFYTHANGQKIYLTWPVPNCNEGCPSSWVNDKYCDKPCNVSECDWDGGDCIGVKRKTQWSYQGWQSQQSSYRIQFCSPGCADTWVGDRYCDVACNVAPCGYDAGDCGIAQFHEIYRIDIEQSTRQVHLPQGILALYFNISKVFGEGKVKFGEYSDTHCVRSATVAQKYKVFTLTLRANCTSDTVTFFIEGFSNKNETNQVKVSFNMTIDTRTARGNKSTLIATTGSTAVPSTVKVSTPRAPPSPSVTVPKMGMHLPITVYPIRIQNANEPINYWIVANQSANRPTWPSLAEKEYNVPHLSNNTVLARHVQIALENVEKEYHDGDLTHKGYARKRAKILNDFLNTGATKAAPLHLAMLTSPLPKANDKPTVPAKPHTVHMAKRAVAQTGEYFNASEIAEKQSHQRKLLSLEIMGLDDLINAASKQAHANIRSTFQDDLNQRSASEDEIFLADWIANTKQKQVSYESDQSYSLKQWRSRYGDWMPQTQESSTSFLPWEKHGTFEHLQKSRERRKHSMQFENFHPPRRKLMDTFADSLLHVHRIYNRKFGYMGRKVPAHMPHMIDVKAMEELHSLLPEEFDQTSSHKLRRSDDMQFAFSYNYFIVGHKKSPNVTEFFAEVDADHSGVLSDRELRTLATRLYNLPLDLNDLHNLEQTLLKCANKTMPETNSSDPSQHVPLPSVTVQFLQKCDPLIQLLNETYKSVTKYKFETLGDDDVAFHMIRDNASAVLQQLDAIRGKKKKFVCLNDNINHGKKDAELIKALLVDFYESLFPIPSQFELPQEYRNRFLHISELEEWVKEREAVKFWTNILMAIFILAAIFTFFPNLFLYLIEFLCPLRRFLLLFQRNSPSSSSRLMTV